MYLSYTTYYLTYDPYLMVKFHKKCLFTQYIFKIPHITYIFYIKFHLINKYFFIVFYLIFSLMIFFY